MYKSYKLRGQEFIKFAIKKIEPQTINFKYKNESNTTSSNLSADSNISSNAKPNLNIVANSNIVAGSSSACIELPT